MVHFIKHGQFVCDCYSEDADISKNTVTVVVISGTGKGNYPPAELNKRNLLYYAGKKEKCSAFNMNNFMLYVNISFNV